MMISEEKKQTIKEIMENTQKAISAVYGTPVSIMYKIKSNNINPNLLLQIVMAHFKLTYGQLISVKRNQELVVPRALFCFLAKGYCGLTQGQIAEMIRRDRTTALHCIAKVQDMIDCNDPLYTDNLKVIEEAIMDQVKENV